MTQLAFVSATYGIFNYFLTEDFSNIDSDNKWVLQLASGLQSFLPTLSASILAWLWFSGNTSSTAVTVARVAIMLHIGGDGIGNSIVAGFKGMPIPFSVFGIPIGTPMTGIGWLHLTGICIVVLSIYAFSLWSWHPDSRLLSPEAILEGVKSLIGFTVSGYLCDSNLRMHSQTRCRLRAFRQQLHGAVDELVHKPNAAVKNCGSGDRNENEDHGLEMAEPTMMKSGNFMDRDTLPYLCDSLKQAWSVMKLYADSDERKSTFLATMSHELRSPLTAIMGCTELVGSDPSLPASTRPLVEAIESSSKQLLTTVNNILDFSKLTSPGDEFQLRPRPFDPKKLATETVAMFKQQAVEKDIEMRVCTDACDPCLWVNGDFTRIGQILANLVSNALKFTKPGGKVSIDLGTCRDTNDDHHDNHSNKPLDFLDTVPGQNLDARLHIRVSDTGIGIKTEDHERLFNPFVQAESGETRSFDGSGLGLSISARLAELMGCPKIEVQSKLGEGTTFVAVLKLGAVSDQVGLGRPSLHRRALSAPIELPIDDEVDSVVDVVLSNPLQSSRTKKPRPRVGSATSTRLNKSTLKVPVLKKQVGTSLHCNVKSSVEEGGSEKASDGHDNSSEVCDTSWIQFDTSLTPVTEPCGDAKAMPLKMPVSTGGAIPRLVNCQLTKPIVGRVKVRKRETTKKVSKEQPLAGIRFLLVDDMRSLRMVGERLISRSGGTVTTANDGCDAVAKVCTPGNDAMQFDFILMDYLMPNMNGVEATAKISAEMGARAPLIIGLTGDVSGTTHSKFMKAGAAGMLTKPYSVDDLAAFVRKHGFPKQQQNTGGENSGSRTAPAKLSRPRHGHGRHRKTQSNCENVAFHSSVKPTKTKKPFQFQTSSGNGTATATSLEAALSTKKSTRSSTGQRHRVSRLHKLQRMRNIQRAKEVVSMNGKRFLVVEDSASVRTVALHMIRGAGGTAESVENGAEAVEAVTKSIGEGAPFDCVLMDFHMPVMSGVEAIRRIRELHGDGSPPILGLTADVMVSTKDKFLESGAKEVLTKPYTMTALAAAVGRHCSVGKAEAAVSGK